MQNQAHTTPLPGIAGPEPAEHFGQAVRVTLRTRGVEERTAVSPLPLRYFLTTHEAAWYIIRGRLSICPSDDNFRKSWCIGSSFSLIRFTSSEYGSSSYKGQTHWSKKVENPYCHNVKPQLAIIPFLHSEP